MVIEICMEKYTELFRAFQSVEKPILFEKGIAEAKPPTGTRGGSTSNIPFPGKGAGE